MRHNIRKNHLKSEHKKFVQRHCNGKRRIESKKKAHGIAEFMSQKHGVKLVEYECEVCGFWHVGHKITRERAEQLRRLRMAA